MIGNKRRHRRQPLERRATLLTLDGGRIGGCTVSDISVGGAKFTLDEFVLLPEEFSLCLTDNGNVYRACRTVWRSDKVVGVQFPHAFRRSRPSSIQGGFRFIG